MERKKQRQINKKADVEGTDLLGLWPSIEACLDKYPGNFPVNRVKFSKPIQKFLHSNNIKTLGDLYRITGLERGISVLVAGNIYKTLEDFARTEYMNDHHEGLNRKVDSTDLAILTSESIKKYSNNFSVSRLKLTPRLKKALRRNGVKKLEDLYDLMGTESGITSKSIDKIAVSLNELINNGYEYKEVIKAEPKVNLKDLSPLIDSCIEKYSPNFPVSAIQFSARVQNVLKNYGVKTLEGLYEITGKERGLGIIGTDNIYSSLEDLKGKTHKYDLQELLEERLEPLELEIIYDRLGLIGEKKTLQEIATLHNLSRERVRQKEEKSFKKIRAAIKPELIDNRIIEKMNSLAYEKTPINGIEGLSDLFHNSAIAGLFTVVIPEQYAIFSNHRLQSNFFVLANEKDYLGNTIEELADCLNFQEGFIDITDLSKHFDLPKHIIIDLKDIVIEDNSIAIRTNGKIFEDVKPLYVPEIIEKALENFGKPMTTKEIEQRSKLNLEQIRGALGRSERIVNIGPSTYALKDWGYLGGSTADIVEYYLEMANEPMPLSSIVNLVKKQRVVSDNAIYAVLYDKRFQRVAIGVYALRKWGYETDLIFERKKYKVNIDDAVMKVLEDKNRFLSTREIRELIIKKFRDQASTNESTISASLYSLSDRKKIIMIKKGFFTYFGKKGLK